MEIFEQILSVNADYYFSQNLEELILIENRGIVKEEIARFRGMRVDIFPNDHNPPHFHVKSKNGDVDAKFRIDNGEYISGKISGSDLKRVKYFYESQKTQIVLEAVWKKFHGDNP